MNKPLLFDTNAAIALLKREADIMQFLQDVEELYLSSIVIGELVFGAYKSQRVRENLDRIDQIVAHYSILFCDEGTAYNYGYIAYQQRTKGRTIPYNDTWIAALARQHNLVLLTRDAHFRSIENINLISW